MEQKDRAPPPTLHLSSSRDVRPARQCTGDAHVSGPARPASGPVPREPDASAARTGARTRSAKREKLFKSRSPRVVRPVVSGLVCLQILRTDTVICVTQHRHVTWVTLQ